jgi:hypothetical protein
MQRPAGRTIPDQGPGSASVLVALLERTGERFVDAEDDFQLAGVTICTLSLGIVLIYTFGSEYSGST